jgi:hypothetical protein
MELTKEQKDALKAWAAEGVGLSDIQSRLRERFSLSLTYMDVRLLVVDLGLRIKEKARPVDVKADLKQAAARRAQPESEPEAEDDWPGEGDDLGDVAVPSAGRAPGGSAGAGSVSVEIDRVTRPGAVMSGTVKFSDGVSATWFLDQFGRLALQAAKPGYQPSAADVQAFQRQLSARLGARGM